MSSPIDVGLSASSSATSGVQFGSFNVTGGGGSGSTALATAPGSTANSTASSFPLTTVLVLGGLVLFGLAFWFLQRKRRR